MTRMRRGRYRVAAKRAPEGHPRSDELMIKPVSVDRFRTELREYFENSRLAAGDVARHSDDERVIGTVLVGHSGNSAGNRKRPETTVFCKARSLDS